MCNPLIGCQLGVATIALYPVSSQDSTAWFIVFKSFSLFYVTSNNFTQVDFSSKCFRKQRWPKLILGFKILRLVDNLILVFFWVSKVPPSLLGFYHCSICCNVPVDHSLHWEVLRAFFPCWISCLTSISSREDRCLTRNVGPFDMSIFPRDLADPGIQSKCWFSWFLVCIHVDL